MYMYFVLDSVISIIKVVVDCHWVHKQLNLCTLQRLWKLVVEEADLLTHLQLVKNMFLLGRGELFLAFIDTADHLMRVPPTYTTEHGKYPIYLWFTIRFYCGL